MKMFSSRDFLTLFFFNISLIKDLLWNDFCCDYIWKLRFLQAFINNNLTDVVMISLAMGRTMVMHSIFCYPFMEE